MSTELPPHPVLAWQDTHSRTGLAGLCEHLLPLGWLPCDTARILLQIGERNRSDIVLDTARALVNAIAEHLPAASVEIVDPVARHDEWGSLRLHRITDEGSVCLRGIGALVLRVPRLWFESYFLVTLAGVSPMPTAGIANVLDAQADPLRRLNNRYALTALAYEAHRLAPSDLVIACGHTRWGDESSERWWVAGPSDVGVEQAVAQAAGIDPLHLPLLSALAQHEVFSSRVAVDGMLAPLRGHLAPHWSTGIASVQVAVSAIVFGLLRDAAAARYNLSRLPHAIRRRLAARKGTAS